MWKACEPRAPMSEGRRGQRLRKSERGFGLALPLYVLQGLGDTHPRGFHSLLTQMLTFSGITFIETPGGKISPAP